jgi:Zn-dependent peptidase ImmA (M78 family)
MADFNAIMKRLLRAGFNRQFVQTAILPDWWADEYSSDPNLLPEIELRVARFLGLSTAAVSDATFSLVPQTLSGARFRQVRDIDPERIKPAVHSAIRIAEAVVRNLRADLSDFDLPPSSGKKWRKLMRTSGGPVGLEQLLADTWNRGIPVIPVETLPSPKFQGLACYAAGRPVILIGHRMDVPGRTAFAVAHELGHLALGDVLESQPLVDAEEDSGDDSAMERRADQYALHALSGRDNLPTLEGKDYRELATNAYRIEKETDIDASLLLASWGRAHPENYDLVMAALRALYRHTNARNLLRGALAEHLNIEEISESDAALLQCVSSDLVRHEPAH